MWTLLGNLISGFLLFRDFFGYVLPGAVFIGIVYWSYPTSDFAKFLAVMFTNGPATPWLPVAIAVTACYLVGQILVALGYLAYDVWNWVIERLECAWRRHVKRKKCRSARAKGRQSKKEAETESEMLYYRYVYPSLFTEHDRRETITILRIGLASALLAGSWFLGSMVTYGGLIVGGFMLYNGREALKHVNYLKQRTLWAARKAEYNELPPFSWSGAAEKAKDKDDE